MARHPFGGRPARLAPALLLCALAPLTAGCAHGRAAERAPASDEARVNVGYGSHERRDLTGAVGSLTAEELDADGYARVSDMLKGRLAGVDVVRQPGGRFSLRVRGTRSLTRNNEPLVVVDGVPLTDGVNALDSLNPRDIARIDVLKDAATTAIYGSRGANGVILISLKRER